jgi:hypothetical protein
MCPRRVACRATGECGGVSSRQRARALFSFVEKRKKAKKRERKH